MEKAFVFTVITFFCIALHAQDPSKFGEYLDSSVVLDVYPDYETFDTMSFPPLDTITEKGVGFVITDWGSADGDWLPLIKSWVPSLGPILTCDVNGNWYYEEPEDQVTYYLATDTRIMVKPEDVIIFKAKN